jgi:hypothetical protein
MPLCLYAFMTYDLLLVNCYLLLISARARGEVTNPNPNPNPKPNPNPNLTLTLISARARGEGGGGSGMPLLRAQLAELQEQVHASLVYLYHPCYCLAD